MTIEYRVTEKEYAAFRLFHALHSRSWWRVLALVFLLFMGGSAPFFLADFAQSSDNTPLWAYLLVLGGFYLVLGAAIIAAGAAGFYLTTKLLFREVKSSYFIGRQTLALKDDHIEEQNAMASTRLTYPAIGKIRFNKRFFYIYVGADRALIVPLSAFQNAEHRRQFLNLLWQKTGLAVVDKKYYRMG